MPEETSPTRTDIYLHVVVGITDQESVHKEIPLAVHTDEEGARRSVIQMRHLLSRGLLTCSIASITVKIIDATDFVYGAINGQS